MRKFSRYWLYSVPRITRQRCGTVAVRQTSNRSFQNPAVQRTSFGPTLRTTTCGPAELLASSGSAETPTVLTTEAQRHREVRKQEDFTSSLCLCASVVNVAVVRAASASS